MTGHWWQTFSDEDYLGGQGGRGWAAGWGWSANDREGSTGNRQ